MTCELKLLFTFLVVVGLMQVQTLVVGGEPQVPCYFIFGDALVDSGNNNRLATIGKANYQPYGIDFPQGQLLGFLKFIPPYALATDQEISTGVNYGSGYSGIRKETGRVLVNIRSDDYTNNYLVPNSYPTSRIYTPDQYAAVLLRQYSQQLKTLYNLGARKIAVYGLGEVLPNVPCCQVPSDGQCIPNSIPCPVRALSLWYDGFHPTEIVNTISATRSYSALSSMDASPYDISHLARL
ncbi:SGNH hydrolase-type esterase domain-containing protein [Artemisia annua]|uniref:SGNH hydrolase-type esterase domain-containing protein n=1 Tax=Artemisia annua TaxID=35608 RepID=A0A2U1NZ35_ARTAN|nr:SGNH hydrolase-type esterase domain-containing protein [Artemisia annua]